MRSPNQKGVGEERSEGEFSHDRTCLDPECWMYSYWWAPPTFLDSLRLSSTKRFSLGVKVLILALTWGKHGCYKDSIHRDFLLFLSSWEDHRKWDLLTHRPWVGTRNWWVLSCVASFQGPRVIRSLGKSGWTRDSYVTIWINPQKYFKSGQTPSFINFHAKLNDKNFSSHFELNFWQWHLKQEWQFSVHKNNISTDNLITSSDLKKQVNGPC